MEQPPEQSNHQSDLPSQQTEQPGEWFADLLNQYEHQQPQAGQILQATVIRVDKDGILVDVGAKREMLIPARDYPRLSQAYLDELTPGKQIPVLVVGPSQEGGELELSLTKGLENQVWDDAEKLMQAGTVLDLDVLGHNRGGLIMRFETLRGFLPFSLVPELQGVRSPKRTDEIKNSLVGKQLAVKVTEVDRARNRLIVSAEAARSERLAERLNEIKKGQVLGGRVVKILDFGVFVDLGGVDGLVHLSQLSWKKGRPSELVKVGEEIEVKVLDVDIERKRISLSRKALLPGPWQTIGDELKAGDYIEGIITRLVDFGAFVKLPMGVEGLVHTSQIGYSAAQNQQGAIKPGDRVLLKVLDVNPERKRVALSMRQVPLERQIAWSMETLEAEAAAEAEAAEAATEAAAPEQAATAPAAPAEDAAPMETAAPMEAPTPEPDTAPAEDSAAAEASETAAAPAAPVEDTVTAGPDDSAAPVEDIASAEPEDSVAPVEDTVTAEPDDSASTDEDSAAAEPVEVPASPEDSAAAPPDDDLTPGARSFDTPS